MYYESMVETWLKDHKLKTPEMQNEPAFYRNLEQRLDTLRAEHKLLTAKPRWDTPMVDFASNDILSLSRTGRIREAFLQEISRHENWNLSAGGSRLQNGNYNYILEVEREMAEFFGSETAFFGNSGFLCNAGITGCVALPGDCYVFDELVHASAHEGMKLGRASHKVSFRHNDVNSLRETLTNLRETHAEFKLGTQSILILIESIYSMNGDVCPLEEFVHVAKQVFPLGNAQFIIDEAHSVGVLGPHGRGLVSMLGLEKEIAIRVHVCSKAMASTGGVILCNKTVRSLMMNQMRFAVYSGAPSFPMVASARAGLQLFRSGGTHEEQERIQKTISYFFKRLTSKPDWQQAVAAGLLSCPVAEGWEQRQFHAHIIPIRTRPRHEQYLFFHNMLANIMAYNFAYPVVPKGESRIRIVVHAHNTEDDVDKLVASICQWAHEMLDLEKCGSNNTLPSAASKVFASQAAVKA
ncbi:8-amino-7-oxononanoate synthase [Metarhizium brunneum]|uniref:8-amino-7-oxononanoate synthase n=1 Tax=Metarhizium brunneum TaxID=500148 RepID=A0A7D5Z851_9HYPO